MSTVATQTDISWVKADQIHFGDPLLLTPAPQTENLTQSTTPSTSTEPDMTNKIETAQGEALSVKTQKQMRRAWAPQHLEVPSPTITTVEVPNSFDPLEIDVGPSIPVHGNGPSSRTRSPVQPPRKAPSTLFSGTKNNFNDFKLLIQDFKSSASCLQETYFKDIEQIQIRQYDSQNYLSPSGPRTTGGS